MNSISFQLKEAMHLLCRDDRWNVLTVLMLHSNIRNRCWPSMDILQEMACNGNRTRATRAKKWLVKHKAVELVPAAQRHPDEKHLPPRQHVYQLTGIIQACDDPECDCGHDGKTYFYFNVQDLKSFDGDTFKNISVDNIDGDTRSNPIPSNPIKEKESVAPDGTTDGEPINDLDSDYLRGVFRQHVPGFVTVAYNREGGYWVRTTALPEQMTFEHGALRFQFVEPITEAHRRGAEWDILCNVYRNTPPEPQPLYAIHAKPGNISQLQWDALRPAYALGSALDVTVTDGDLPNFKRVAKALLGSSIPLAHFSEYVQTIQKLAASETGWTVTVNSLVTNGRMSNYISGKYDHLKPQSQPKPVGELQTVWDLMG